MRMKTFETQIAKDLYWVPVMTLGAATYPTEMLKQMLHSSPDEKRQAINSLADAINLFRVSNFQEASDAILLTENDGVVWEHHKPGYISVLSNEGCCSSCASWLTYLMEGKYDAVGLLNYMRPNGNGHCVNYIYHENWYYFIDMSLQINKYVTFTAKETGFLADYIKSRPIANVFMKAKSKKAYVDYIIKYQKTRNNVFMFSACECSYVPPLSITMNTDRIHIRYPLTYEIELLNAEQAVQQYTYEFVAPPKKKPCWNNK